MATNNATGTPTTFVLANLRIRFFFHHSARFLPVRLYLFSSGTRSGSFPLPNISLFFAMFFDVTRWVRFSRELLPRFLSIWWPNMDKHVRGPDSETGPFHRALAWDLVACLARISWRAGVYQQTCCFAGNWPWIISLSITERL